MAYYEDFEKLDKICPLLSIRQVVKDDGVIYCLGKNCMLFDNYCKSKSITIAPPSIIVTNKNDQDDNSQKEEAWTYWKLFYGRKNIDTAFGQYIKCGDCGFEIPFEWNIPEEKRDDVLPTECPCCHLPVRIDQTCGGVKRG